MGATYLFTVNGNTVHQVVEWDCGDIDPGKEELRVATGGLYPGCTVSDYNQKSDTALPREVHGYENGVITNLVGVIGNVPGAGPIVVGIAKAVAPIVKQIPIIGGLFH
jgi:hypothetical protein